MKNEKKLMQLLLLIMGVILGLTFHIGYVNQQINKDLSSYCEKGSYVYYYIKDDEKHLKEIMLRKKLDGEMTQKYHAILESFKNVWTLTAKEKYIKDEADVYIAFSMQPGAPLFFEDYYIINTRLCTCDNYSDLYNKLLDLTKDYMETGYETYPLP